MLSSSSSGSDQEITNSNTTKTRKISDYSTSSSSSKSSFSSNIPRNMEEVWKDINSSSLHDHTNPSGTTTSLTTTSLPFPHPNNIRSIQMNQNNFQDFLARPFSTTNNVVSSMASPPPPPPPPSHSLHLHHHPATALSLNSSMGGPDQFRFLNDNPFHHHDHHQIISRPSSSTTITNNTLVNPMNMMINSSTITTTPNLSSCFTNDIINNPLESSLSSLGKKRFPCGNHSRGNGTGDRRHNRMIKNRESAARSRARKQAYTNELELEVAHLMEENARLRKQQEQICLAAAAQLPKKHSLHRTSTAPF